MGHLAPGLAATHGGCSLGGSPLLLGASWPPTVHGRLPMVTPVWGCRHGARRLSECPLASAVSLWMADGLPPCPTTGP